MELTVLHPQFPAGVNLIVSRIEAKHKEIKEANPWEMIGIEFKKAPFVKQADVYTNANHYYSLKKICRFGALIVEKKRAPKRVKSFVAALAFVSNRTFDRRSIFSFLTCLF